MSYQNSPEHLANFFKASELGAQKQKEMKKNRIEIYNLNPKLCVHCQTPLEYSKSTTNKFCSSICFGYYKGKNKPYKHSEITKEKISQSITKIALKNNPDLKMYNGVSFYQKTCGFCRSLFNTKRKKKICCSPECGGKLAALKSSHKKGEIVRRQKETIAKRIAEGSWTGWSSRLKKSFPEQYICGLLLEQNLKEYEHYRCELPQGGYFVDFAFEKQKIAFEVDGKQHEYPENKERDRRKDEFLVSQGWSVYRLKWYSVKKEAGKKKVHDQFEKIVSIIKKSITEHHE